MFQRPLTGFCHFPPRDLDFFDQLLAEKPVCRFVNGVATRVWVKPSNARNEALDCRIYSLCALYALRSYGFNLDKQADKVAEKPVLDLTRPPDGSRPLSFNERLQKLMRDNDGTRRP